MGREEQVSPLDKVRSALRDGAYLIELDNPPTGALSSDVRALLSEKLDEAEAAESVVAVVITGQGNCFATGAGVSEHTEIDAPSLADLCDRIERFSKPVCAAINGTALGGGLELALAAHLRVANAEARLGSPEITIGLVPNAGGTQRLPKVVGGVAALKMLLSGRAINGKAARQLGLVDELAEAELVDVTVQRALALAQSQGALRRSSERRDRLGEGAAFLEAVREHRKFAEASALDAPLRLIECIESALLLPYEAGRGLESAAYDDLVDSEQSKALRHVFSAERRLQTATRWEGRVISRPLNTIAVVGARGICAEFVVLCLDAGFNVIVAEESDEALEDGTARIIEHFDARVAANQMSEEDTEAVLDRMQAVSGYRIVADADLVIDPWPKLTKERAQALDGVMKAGAVLALGAERVGIAQAANATSRPADVVGLRFFPGLRKNRLVEVSANKETSPKAMATVRAFARKLDRLILHTGSTTEGIGSRLFEAMNAAADLCLEEGARYAQIDLALKDWGIPFGSFGFRDVIGLDRPTRPRNVADDLGGGLDAVLLNVGRRGLVTRQGYFQYQRDKASEDPAVEALVEKLRVKRGLRPRTISDGEVRKRCLAAMVGVGAQILTDEIVKRPDDIDMVAVHELGFARRTGGVMFAGDRLGLSEVRKLLDEMTQLTPRIAPPPKMLLDLERTGKSFSDLNF